MNGSLTCCEEIGCIEVPEDCISGDEDEDETPYHTPVSDVWLPFVVVHKL